MINEYKIFIFNFLEFNSPLLAVRSLFSKMTLLQRWYSDYQLFINLNFNWKVLINGLFLNDYKRWPSK